MNIDKAAIDDFEREFNSDPDVGGDVIVDNQQQPSANNEPDPNAPIDFKSLDEDENVKKHLYKILVIGDYAVGKTSIIKRYCTGLFSPNYKLTIGVDFAVKELLWDPSTLVRLQLWDIAGHERFGTMTRVYYKYAIAAIIVFDISRPSTFEAVTKWRDDINSKVVLGNQEPIPVLLLANKSDLKTSVIDKEMLDQFVKEHNFIGWYATSAQSNSNIDEAMKFLTEKVLQVAKTNSPPKPEENLAQVNSSNTNNETKTTSSCCK
ncbi:hypothetical protein CYY_004646 [Polysphondylium violaceum]|uniref:Ras-related protein Rab n=1 Tax=Polysphondylium violaceum TaxID=133409 RepID=A0A8J4PUT9_9MYCE|nr:hypothetical protein CYY_004646 [Polysphondylium violaceum]